MKKRMIALVVTMVMLFGVCLTAMASGNEMSEEEFNMQALQKLEDVKEVIDQLGELRANKELIRFKGVQEATLMVANNNVALTTLTDAEAALESKLKELGAVTLSSAEVEQLHQGDVAPLVNVPTSTEDTQWYSTETVYRYGAKTYNVMNVFAQGMEVGSSLLRSGSKVFYTNKEIILSDITDFVSIYVQKAIGLVPIVQWTPYELFFGLSESVRATTQNVLYSSISTVCFSYVGVYGDSPDSMELMRVSDKINISTTHGFTGVDEGVPFTRTSDEQLTTEEVDSYSNIILAVQNYINGVPEYCFLATYRIEAMDSSPDSPKYEAVVVNLPTPTQPSMVD